MFEQNQSAYPMSQSLSLPSNCKQKVLLTESMPTLSINSPHGIGSKMSRKIFLKIGKHLANNNNRINDFS